MDQVVELGQNPLVDGLVLFDEAEFSHDGFFVFDMRAQRLFDGQEGRAELFPAAVGIGDVDAIVHERDQLGVFGIDLGVADQEAVEKFQVFHGGCL